MAEVALTQGFIALVDDEDLPKVSRWKWRIQKDRKVPTLFYARRKNLLMHRFILGIADRTMYIDHINGNGLDNRRANLRLATRAQNLANSRKRKGTASKFKGVRFRPDCTNRPWQAVVYHLKRSYQAGFFKTEEEAHAAYMLLAGRIFGEFASDGHR